MAGAGPERGVLAVGVDAGAGVVVKLQRLEVEMKEGDDFPQGDKILRKEDHQAFLREFIFEIKGGKPKIVTVVPKEKTIFPPACKFA